MAKKWFTLIYEDVSEIPLQNTEPAYRIGPYDTYEEADDAFYVACYHVKPDVDDVGNAIYWNHDIEPEGEDDVVCLC